MKNPNNIFKAILFTFTLLCATAAPKAFAVVPAPDGGYPGFNTAEGTNALKSLTTGIGNTAVGWFSLWSNTDGSFNTALGAGTLLFNVGDQGTEDGVQNTAVGALALFNNTTGTGNTADGAFALFNNTDGDANTATGQRALNDNTTGSYNTANGASALFSNTEGNFNTATGDEALLFNTTGSNNTANGVTALFNNTEGYQNTAAGHDALHSNITGYLNTAIGDAALYSNTTGAGNVALGQLAGWYATTGNGNVYIGQGMVGVPGESSACYIASIFGQTSADGVQVYINSNNKLGTLTSSKRFKEEIKPMDKASEALLALRPVTFRYKKEIDRTGRSQFGLVAEEVDKVNPDLVVHDKDGKPYTVRYDAVNAMLLNEFLKEHCRAEEQDRKIKEQEATIAQQRAHFERTTAQQHKQIEALTASVKEQATQIQRVSAQIELNKPATQQVALKTP
jgi:Chaperone of endosialidase